MPRLVDAAFDVWRGAPFTPENPCATLMSDRELAIAKQAFEGGIRDVLRRVEARKARYQALIGDLGPPTLPGQSLKMVNSAVAMAILAAELEELLDP